MGKHPKAKWWILPIIAPLNLLRFIAAPAYDLVFGWLDRRSARIDEERLANDIQLSMRFLFTQEKASIIQNEGVPFPPAFDYAFVTIAVGNLLLRFCRGRGELGVHVAPAFAPSDWHELSLVLGVVRRDNELSRNTFHDLWEVSEALQPYLGAIAARFSPDQFQKLRKRLEADVYTHDRIERIQGEARISSWVYPRKD